MTHGIDKRLLRSPAGNLHRFDACLRRKRLQNPNNRTERIERDGIVSKRARNDESSVYTVMSLKHGRLSARGVLAIRPRVEISWRSPWRFVVVLLFLVGRVSREVSLFVCFENLHCVLTRSILLAASSFLFFYRNAELREASRKRFVQHHDGSCRKKRIINKMKRYALVSYHKYRAASSCLLTNTTRKTTIILQQDEFLPTILRVVAYSTSLYQIAYTFSLDSKSFGVQRFYREIASVRFASRPRERWPFLVGANVQLPRAQRE